MRTEAKKLFESRFCATKDLGVRLDGVEFQSLSTTENETFVAMFSKEEINEAV